MYKYKLYHLYVFAYICKQLVECVAIDVLGDCSLRSDADGDRCRVHKGKELGAKGLDLKLCVVTRGQQIWDGCG